MRQKVTSFWDDLDEVTVWHNYLASLTEKRSLG